MTVTTISTFFKKKGQEEKKTSLRGVRECVGGEPHPTQTNPQIVTMVCLLQVPVWELAKCFSLFNTWEGGLIPKIPAAPRYSAHPTPGVLRFGPLGKADKLEIS